MATYRDNLVAARDRYAAELAAQVPPPDYSWNEYETFLLDQIVKLNKLLDEYDASQAASEAAGEIEVISGGLTA